MRNLTVILFTIIFILPACKSDEENIEEYVELYNSFIEQSVELNMLEDEFVKKFGREKFGYDGFTKEGIRNFYDNEEAHDLYLDALVIKDLMNFQYEEMKELYPKLPAEWKRQHPHKYN